MSVLITYKAKVEVVPLVNPMLAAEGVLGQMTYPKLASPKFNGVRGGVQNGLLYARSLKLIPNLHVRRLYSNPLLNGVNGELVVGDFADEEVFVKSTSGVMGEDGVPDVRFYGFDWYHPILSFKYRIQKLEEIVHRYEEARTDGGLVVHIPHRTVHSDKEVEVFANEMLDLGYEGLVLRDPAAPYKKGRSTANEGGFLRFCPWLRSEAVILGVEEGMENKNESVVNELGYKKKASHKENKVGIGAAGAMKVRDVKTNIVFNMPVPGVALGKDMWDTLDRYVGKLAKYKFKPPVKKGGKPRFPQYEGLRSELDMS